MSDNGSEQKLAEIEARVKAVTPGEWCLSMARTDDEDSLIYVGDDSTLPRRTVILMVSAVIDPIRPEGSQNAANVEFIAAAPADIRYLLAQLREARAALARREVFSVWHWEYDDGGTVGIYSTREAAEAAVHAAAQTYNATAEEGGRMEEGRTSGGQVGYADRGWNHRIGVTVYELDAQAHEDGSEPE